MAFYLLYLKDGIVRTLVEGFQVHDQLNPKLWGKDNKLLPEVKEKILEIVDAFKDASAISFDEADIQIVGSSASFNYTEKSDLDIHIIVNYELLDASEEISKALFAAEQSDFNGKYDILIRGIEASIYVQDIQSGIHSNGIYSVMADDWIKFPKKLDKVPQFDDRETLSKWVNKLNDLLKTGSLEEVEEAINILYLIRKNSLAADGEYGRGNLLFKEIRNLGLTKRLKQKRNDLRTKKLSLESLQQ